MVLMLSVKYSFMKLINSKVDPSIHVGGGYTFFGDSSYGTLNPGAGLAFWFTDNVGFLLQLQKLLEIEKMLMAFLIPFSAYCRSYF
jgi:hypothetical protein